MAYSSIVKPSDYFNTKTYSGSGSAQNIVTGTFQPDLIWVKSRSNGVSHILSDAVRGIGKQIFSNLNAAQTSYTNALTAFRSDGFTTDTGGETGQSGRTYVAWNWKAGTGQGSANTDGSINTTYTSVNTTAGFSISSYTGTGSNATVGHGLGVAPGMVIIKRLNSTGAWPVWHSKPGSINEIVELNSTGAQQSGSSYFNNSAPTSSVFPLGTSGDVNASGGTYIAYCFSGKKGYSKIDSYTGNGNANGPFVYTGFKPAFVIVKRTNDTGNWHINDTKRDPFNQATHSLYPNLIDSENATGWFVDYVSNGFKIRDSGATVNELNGTFMYMAIAEEPLVSNSGIDGVPATAR